VISASSDGPRELIKDGENGLLVPVEDADTLAATIKQLAGDRAYGTRLANAGYRTFQAEFSESKVIKLYQEFFTRSVG
jgi:glycosyltransferase involved in cell wall biosynthesis